MLHCFGISKVLSSSRCTFFLQCDFLVGQRNFFNILLMVLRMFGLCRPLFRRYHFVKNKWLCYVISYIHSHIFVWYPKLYRFVYIIWHYLLWATGLRIYWSIKYSMSLFQIGRISISVFQENTLRPSQSYKGYFGKRQITVSFIWS